MVIIDLSESCSDRDVERARFGRRAGYFAVRSHRKTCGKTGRRKGETYILAVVCCVCLTSGDIVVCGKRNCRLSRLTGISRAERHRLIVESDFLFRARGSVYV